MSGDREMCRRAASECIELARITADPAKKELLLVRAQEWIKLAYAENQAEFERQVARLNDEQMIPAAPVAVQRQPMQQQQGKIEPEDKK